MSKRNHRALPEGGEPSFTLAEWCALRKISRSAFYQLKADGRAPRTYRMREGGKLFILPEADRQWQRERLAEIEAKA
jgi:predicted DNA-binding transcriptional regulator AlpA